MSTAKVMYATLEAYYAADERCLRSEEADYGVHWRLQGWDYRWRVSYIRNTGEVYVVHQGATIGPVFVLGYVPPDDVDERDRRSLFYSTLERILAEWPEYCGRPDGLRWVRDRLDDVEKAVKNTPAEVSAGAYAAGRCLGCGHWIGESTQAEWTVAVGASCPHCGRPGW